MSQWSSLLAQCHAVLDSPASVEAKASRQVCHAHSKGNQRFGHDCLCTDSNAGAAQYPVTNQDRAALYRVMAVRTPDSHWWNALQARSDVLQFLSTTDVHYSYWDNDLYQTRVTVTLQREGTL